MARNILQARPARRLVAATDYRPTRWRVGALLPLVPVPSLEAGSSRPGDGR